MSAAGLCTECPSIGHNCWNKAPSCDTNTIKSEILTLFDSWRHSTQKRISSVRITHSRGIIGKILCPWKHKNAFLWERIVRHWIRNFHCWTHRERKSIFGRTFMWLYSLLILLFFIVRSMDLSTSLEFGRFWLVFWWFLAWRPDFRGSAFALFHFASSGLCLRSSLSCSIWGLSRVSLICLIFWTIT